MIERYQTPEMASLWSLENLYAVWLEVEITALEEMEKAGLAEKGKSEELRALALKPDPRAIQKIEEEVKHDVIAFLTHVENLAGESARSLHRGMTSSDLIDSSLAVLLKKSGELILKSLDSNISLLRDLAEKYKSLPCIGRTHGIHAEPTTIGLKFLSWYSELKRVRKSVEEAVKGIAYGKISGPVGTLSSLTPEIESSILQRLGLNVEPVATQVVARDRHAAFFTSLALLGSSIERFATEIRHLQRTEVAEFQESFTKGQKGSSAMPHKKNPILSENLCGLARLLRGYALSAMENINLWHERDISHSSVERVIGPDGTTVAHFMLERLNRLLSGLVVNEANVTRNLNLLGGVALSSQLLSALIDKGVSRQEAYKAIQEAAHKCLDEGASFVDKLIDNARIQESFTREEIQEVLKPERALGNVDAIYQRTINEDV